MPIPNSGEPTVLLLDGGDPFERPALGGYGAVAVAEPGAVFRDPTDGEEVTTGWRVDVIRPTGPAYRDAVLFLQEEDAAIGTHLMPYRDAVEGTVGINYRFAPLEDRLLGDPDPARVFSSTAHGDPPTPLIEAYAGDPLRLRVLAPTSEQGQVFGVEGHRWRQEQRRGAMLVSSIQLGGLEAMTIDLEGGAGGPARLPGDYLYGDHREPYREAGLWGLLRVREPCAAEEGLRPLPTAHASCRGIPGVVVGLLVGVGILGVGVGMWRSRRRPRDLVATG